MNDGCVRIEKAHNGYTVNIQDPAIVEANNKRDNSKGPYVPWRDPWQEFVFDDLDKTLRFLKLNLPKAMAPKKGDYETSFTLAAKETE